MEVSTIATFNLFDIPRVKFILPNGKYVWSSFSDAFVSQKDLRMLYMIYHDKDNIECPKSARQMFILCNNSISYKDSSPSQREEAYQHYRECIRNRRLDLIKKNDLCKQYIDWKWDYFGLRKRLHLAICCWSLIYHANNYIHYSCPFTQVINFRRLAIWNAKIYKSDFNIQHIIYHNLITMRYLTKKRTTLKYSNSLYSISYYDGRIMYTDYQKIIKKIDQFIKYLKSKYIIFSTNYKIGPNTKLFKKKLLWNRFKKKYVNLNIEQLPKSNNNSVERYLISYLYFCLPHSLTQKPCIGYKKRK